MSQSLLEMTKDLVMAQIEAHRLSPEDMHQALQQTYASLQALQAQEDANGSIAVATPVAPAEPIHWKKSITKHTVTVDLPDGWLPDRPEAAEWNQIWGPEFVAESAFRFWLPDDSPELLTLPLPPIIEIHRPIGTQRRWLTDAE